MLQLSALAYLVPSYGEGRTLSLKSNRVELWLKDIAKKI